MIRAFHKTCLKPSIIKIYLKITCLKFHSNFPGANELNFSILHMYICELWFNCDKCSWGFDVFLCTIYSFLWQERTRNSHKLSETTSHSTSITINKFWSQQWKSTTIFVPFELVSINSRRVWETRVNYSIRCQNTILSTFVLQSSKVLGSFWLHRGSRVTIGSEYFFESSSRKYIKGFVCVTGKCSGSPQLANARDILLGS